MRHITAVWCNPYLARLNELEESVANPKVCLGRT